MEIPAVLNPGLNFNRQEGVWITAGEEPPTEFEKLYVLVRQKEGRILSLANIQKLPHFAGANSAEWRIRSASSLRLVNYLKAKNKNPTILELGCGNGWLATLLARHVEATVIAVDYQITELKQGATAFADQPNLQFVYGNIMKDLVKARSIDVVVLAASFQYFSDSAPLLRKLLSLLKPDGEIHILDSPLYPSLQKAGEARNRSLAHFTAMGFPEMADHYFHPLERDLDVFQPHYLFASDSLLSRIKRKLFPNSTSVFPWIVIRNRPIALSGTH